jgi:hypothetical protein
MNPLLLRAGYKYFSFANCTLAHYCINTGVECVFLHFTFSLGAIHSPVQIGYLQSDIILREKSIRISGISGTKCIRIKIRFASWNNAHFQKLSYSFYSELDLKAKPFKRDGRSALSRFEPPEKFKSAIRTNHFHKSDQL